MIFKREADEMKSISCKTLGYKMHISLDVDCRNYEKEDLAEVKRGQQKASSQSEHLRVTKR